MKVFNGTRPAVCPHRRRKHAFREKIPTIPVEVKSRDCIT